MRPGYCRGDRLGICDQRVGGLGNLLRPPLDDDADSRPRLRGYGECGGFLPIDWEATARLADMFSFADILSRSATNAVVVEDAKATSLIAS